MVMIVKLNKISTERVRYLENGVEHRGVHARIGSEDENN